jgi:hypothetical protein
MVTWRNVGLPDPDAPVQSDPAAKEPACRCGHSLGAHVKEVGECTASCGCMGPVLSGRPEGPSEEARENQIRDGIAKLEACILHHLIERDGWTPQDECYRQKVDEVVAGLVKREADLRAKLAEAEKDRDEALARQILLDAPVEAADDTHFDAAVRMIAKGLRQAREEGRKEGWRERWR